MLKNINDRNNKTNKSNFLEQEYVLLTNAPNIYDYVHMVGMLYSWMTVFDLYEKEGYKINGAENIEKLKEDLKNFPKNIDRYRFDDILNKNLLFHHVISSTDIIKFINKKNDNFLYEGKKQNLIKADVVGYKKNLVHVISFLEEEFQIKNMHKNLCINFYDDSINNHELTFYQNQQKYTFTYNDLEKIDTLKNETLPLAKKMDNGKYRLIEDIQLQTFKNSIYNLYIKYYEVQKVVPYSNKPNQRGKESDKFVMSMKIQEIFTNITNKFFNYQRNLFGKSHIKYPEILESEKKTLAKIRSMIHIDIEKRFMYDIKHPTNIDILDIKNNKYNDIRTYNTNGLFATTKSINDD